MHDKNSASCYLCLQFFFCFYFRNKSLLVIWGFSRSPPSMHTLFYTCHMLLQCIALTFMCACAKPSRKLKARHSHTIAFESTGIRQSARTATSCAAQQTVSTPWGRQCYAMHISCTLAGQNMNATLAAHTIATHTLTVCRAP